MFNSIILVVYDILIMAENARPMIAERLNRVLYKIVCMSFMMKF